MRLLLVEDEAALVRSLRWGLEREGYAVDVATDGEQGLWKACEQQYDVVVLDLMLPGLDGYQVCARMRQAGRWTPVLMLTALDDDLDVAEGLDVGADDYLPKPFSYPVLLARLRALIRRGAAERPVVLAVGGLRLDPASRRCRAGDTDVRLTTREFAVLEYLARRPGSVVSKAELLAHCWDENWDGDPAVVEVHVSRLRRKLTEAAGASAIRTVRGAGYCLDGDA